MSSNNTFIRPSANNSLLHTKTAESVDEKNSKGNDGNKSINEFNENGEESGQENVLEQSEKNENGDIYYLLSKAFEITKDNESRLDSIELALENKKTLTFNHKAVEREYKQLSAK